MKSLQVVLIFLMAQVLIYEIMGTRAYAARIKSCASIGRNLEEIEKYQLIDGAYVGTPLQNFKKSVRWTVDDDLVIALTPEVKKLQKKNLVWTSHIRGLSADQYYLTAFEPNAIRGLKLLITKIPGRPFQHIMLEFQFNTNSPAHILREGVVNPEVETTSSLVLSVTPLKADMIEVPQVNKYGDLSGLVYMILTRESYEKYLTKNDIPEVEQYDLHLNESQKLKLWMTAVDLSERRGGKYQFCETNNCATSTMGVFEESLGLAVMSAGQKKIYETLRRHGVTGPAAFTMAFGKGKIGKAENLKVETLKKK